MTIRLGDDAKAKLDGLATHTHRSRSYFMAEAVAAYVERQLDIVEGIERGLADVASGRLVPPDEAMAENYGVIHAAARARGMRRPVQWLRGALDDHKRQIAFISADRPQRSAPGRRPYSRD